MSQFIEGYVANPSDINTPPVGEIRIFKNSLDGKYYSKISTGAIELLGGGINSALSGTATMVAGHVVVANPLVQANAVILVAFEHIIGGAGTIFARKSLIVPGVSFEINSDSPGDNSSVNYLIINP